MNNIEMYSTFNEIKSAVAQRFIRTLKNKILKHMTALLKMFVLMCYMILPKNTITHFTTLLKWNQLMLYLILLSNTVTILIKKSLRFQVGDHVRISKYKNIFANRYTPNWSE